MLNGIRNDKHPLALAFSVQGQYLPGIMQEHHNTSQTEGTGRATQSMQHQTLNLVQWARLPLGWVH